MLEPSTFQCVRIDEIACGQRVMRPLEGFAGLQDSIRDLGLRQPIQISSDFKLLAGQHRLAACKALGHATIEAMVVPYPYDSLEAELIQLDESLENKEVPYLRWVEMLARRKEIYKRLHPRWERSSNGKSENASTFAEKMAEQVGVTSRTIYMDLSVAKLAPDVRDAIRDTELGEDKTQLRELAKHDPDMQRNVVAMLLDGGAAKVQDAVAALEEAAITPEEYRQRICFPALRHLTGTKHWNDRDTLRELAKLPEGDQMDVADMLACGDVDSVKDGVLVIERRKVDSVKTTDKPIETTKMVERHCRQIQPGQYQVCFDVDQLGFERSLELLEKRGMYTSLGGELRIPGGPMADLIRQVLREAWERDVRLGLDGKRPQDLVARSMDVARKDWDDPVENIGLAFSDLYESWVVRDRDGAVKAITELQVELLRVADSSKCDAVAEAVAFAEAV